MEINREIKNITSAFVLEDNLTECVPYGSGHINDTYRLTYGTGKHYILQKMNRSIFTKPVELMENVSGVTAWLKKKIQENGGDVERETLNLVMTKDGLPYYVDEDGEYWRVYLFIENATCYDMVKDEEDFYQSAVAFGHFQRLLADYPAETLHETIVNFHNTVDRLDKFKTAVEKDICHRAADVEKEIQFVLDRTELDMLPMGAILMTFECGMRFLTDYLEGDHYFKIHREGHNLDRCRTQFKLVKDMEEKLSRMKEIVNKYKRY